MTMGNGQLSVSSAVAADTRDLHATPWRQLGRYPRSLALRLRDVRYDNG
jgi:hypothetical protein